MKTIAANPTILDTIQTWAQANPMEFFAGMTIALAVFCYAGAIRDSL